MARDEHQDLQLGVAACHWGLVPRVPAVFERKRKWQFEQEAQLGAMVKLTLAQAQLRYAVFILTYVDDLLWLARGKQAAEAVAVAMLFLAACAIYVEEALVSERARSDSLHERLSASDGTAQSSKTELSNQQDMAGGLRSSNQKLQVDLEKERSARVQLLHELQQLKKAELAELKDPRLDSASILPVTAPSP
ncbi:unnamed protein product [Effrenium voratum]|nr:unnamed protein product [Effrenium voratum]